MARLAEVCITNQPRQAVLVVAGAAETVQLTLVNPRPLAPLCENLDDCCEIRIVDVNHDEKGHLEFGRFRVELWDEDNSIGELVCDEYSSTRTG